LLGIVSLFGKALISFAVVGILIFLISSVTKFSVAKPSTEGILILLILSVTNSSVARPSVEGILILLISSVT
jgi:hypothetical protein